MVGYDTSPEEKVVKILVSRVDLSCSYNCCVWWFLLQLSLSSFPQDKIDDLVVRVERAYAGNL